MDANGAEVCCGEDRVGRLAVHAVQGERHHVPMQHELLAAARSVQIHETTQHLRHRCATCHRLPPACPVGLLVCELPQRPTEAGPDFHLAASSSHKMRRRTCHPRGACGGPMPSSARRCEPVRGQRGSVARTRARVCAVGVRSSAAREGETRSSRLGERPEWGRRGARTAPSGGEEGGHTAKLREGCRLPTAVAARPAVVSRSRSSRLPPRQSG